MKDMTSATPPNSAESRCELCEAARFTHWYSEDETCWIADCEVCLVPMVVWRHHGVDPTPAETDHMHARLAQAADARFGEGNWNLDGHMRQIPDHFHAHARDEHWFRRRSQRALSRYTGVGGTREERAY